MQFLKKLHKLDGNKYAGPGDAIADIMIIAIIVFVIAVFFVFFVKFAAQETKLSLDANRIKLDVTYDLLYYLRTPVADTSDKTFAETIESYMVTKNPLEYGQLQEFYENNIMKTSSRCKLITIERKSSTQQIIPAFPSLSVEQTSLGSCKIVVPLRSQVILPLYHQDEYVIVEYSVDITGEVTQEVIKKYFNLVNNDK
ncbi:hypothetical protein HYY69_07885 [Candidatus Woesearchaeota archaeon]|nr:hypothetical protein [Candidatus Woesearchaeota archaeon]